jgi:hypothetical protein
MVGRCLNCGKPLPRDAPIRQKFDSLNCRVMWHRRKKDPRLDSRQKVPASNGTGDPELDKIIYMDTEASIRCVLLKEALEKKKLQWQREALEANETHQEERVLDPDTSRRVARILATETYVS